MEAKKIDLGSVHVHKKVIIEIIHRTLAEIKGIHLAEVPFWKKIFSFLNKEDAPGIMIMVNEESSISLSIRILVQYGVSIVQIAHKIQDLVRADIEKSLEVNIKDINVDVQGIERSGR